jgi:outer membrane protein OmpA-like peptidoglycan-associated protein
MGRSLRVIVPKMPVIFGLFLLMGWAQAHDGNTYREQYSLGESLRKAAQWEDALTAYRKAWGKAADEKEYAIACYRIGQMFAKMDQPEVAMLWFKQSLESHRYLEVENELKQLELQTRQSVVKADSIKKALTIPPSKSPAVVPSLDLEVLFAFDSDQISSEGIRQVQELALALGDPSLSAAHFRIIGHTDKRGTEEYNLDLSTRRARAVVNCLTSRFQISPDRLDAEGHGKKELRYPGDTEEDHRLNRRVEVRME